MGGSKAKLRDAGHRVAVDYVGLPFAKGFSESRDERISALSLALADEFKFKDDNRLALGALNEPLNLSVRELREMFRPFLKARYIKDHELKNAREILSKMERMQPDDAEYPTLYLQARAMLEDFEILKFKRKGDDSEEVIEDDALAKLKKSFGRLR